MPENIQAVIATIGAIAFFAGLFGGFKAKDIEISALPLALRGVSFVIGMILIGISAWPFVRDQVLVPPTLTSLTVLPTNIPTHTSVPPTVTQIGVETPTPIPTLVVATPTETPIPPTDTSVPPTDTPISLANTPISEPLNTLSSANTPQIYNFFALDKYGNVSDTFEEGTKEIYLQWNYKNFPIGAFYVRTWTMNDEKWVRYYCIWPGPETGKQEITLREPGGLHSGTWELSIYVNDHLLLREQIFIEGSWDYWDPVEDDINRCKTRY
jgi:hypothetical protein